MPPTRGISCLSLVLYGIRMGSEGLAQVVCAYYLDVIQFFPLLSPLYTRNIVSAIQTMATL